MPRKDMPNPRRRICFVTGSRAEFGLMCGVLSAISKSKRLQLQIVVTGMHLSRRHGNTIREIESDGWNIEAVVPWRGNGLAEATGRAIAGLGKAFAKLNPDIVLIVGDRVEAFAAATAAHLHGIAVAHVHGGDRALGQVDDSLRHAITKLSHIHFPATKQSAKRIAKLGEQNWRIHRVGSPGVEGIRKMALLSEYPCAMGVPPMHLASKKSGSLRFTKHLGSQAVRTGGTPVPRGHGQFALVLLHPQDADENLESKRAEIVLNAVRAIPFERIVICYPNNDPGSAGIMRLWESQASDSRLEIHKSIPRNRFLQLLRDATVLVGNSSSGIIEAASFGTPVVDIGNRQLGRERCKDVRNVPYRREPIYRAIHRIWNGGKPLRGRSKNPYERPGTAQKITGILQNAGLNDALCRKIISY